MVDLLVETEPNMGVCMNFDTEVAMEINPAEIGKGEEYQVPGNYVMPVASNPPVTKEGPNCYGEHIRTISCRGVKNPF